MKPLTPLFPISALIGSLLAFIYPAPFLALKSAIVPLLGIIMLGMGMTLTLADFRRILAQPKLIFLGVLLQYSLMPLAAYLVATALGLSTPLLIGMVLVGCSAGGTASNVICYLAKGDVALSISLTLASTLLAVVAMPSLTWLYIGESVPVPMAAMFMSIVKVIIVPLTIGVFLNTLLHKRIEPLKPRLPLVSIAAIVIIIAIIVAINKESLASVGAVVVLAVILHNALGLFFGYQIGKKLGLEPTVCRTLAIEVGMQNSGLSATLALQFFSPLSALPAALFSIWHNLSGAILASLWRRVQTAAAKTKDSENT